MSEENGMYISKYVKRLIFGFVPALLIMKATTITVQGETPTILQDIIKTLPFSKGVFLRTLIETRIIFFRKI